MTTSRNAVMDALANLVRQATQIETVGRRLKMWNKVTEFPAAFIRHTGDEYAKREAQAFPAKVTLDVEIWLYSNAGEDPDEPPDKELNRLIDQIEKFMQPGVGTVAPNLIAMGVAQNKQTLGGLVDRAWIEGRVECDPGDLDGRAKAIIPVKILVPSFVY